VRILLVVRPCQGGIATHVRLLARGLKKEGHQVHIAAPDAAFASEGDDYFPLPLAVHPAKLLQAAEALTAIVGRLRPDIVHAHGALAAVLRPLVGRRSARSTPWVYTVHNLPLGFAAQLAWRAAWLGGGPERVIAVSRTLATRLGYCGVPPERIVVIPNGIELEQVPAYNLLRTPDEAVILTISRLVPEKGTAYLLHALASLKATHPYLRLLVAGDGPERPRLERLAQTLRVTGKVQFLGFVPDPGRLFPGAYLFATAPVSEGMGVANLEAMAWGRPVISTRVGGIPEVVVHGETGLLVPPRRPLELAQAIRLVIDDPVLARRLGRAGAARSRRHFAAGTMVAATLKVYEEAQWACYNTVS
jgi:glycosyltransferase involved in cell wall biosynthesis